MDGKIPKNDEIFDGLKDCLENFGKLYALFGLVLLKQKEDTQRTLYIGFKQLQAVSLNYKNPYLPCE